MKHVLAWPALVVLAGLTLSGCKTDLTPAPAGDVPASGSPEAPAAAPVADGSDAVPTVAPREMNLLEKGRRRTVALKEAAAGVPFALLEPKMLPKDSARSVVHLIEKIEGIENEALPAVRQIFDLSGGGSLILVQSMARDDLGGEANTKVGDVAARAETVGEQRLLVFERDGVQFELRSNQLTAAQLQEIAGSLAAVDLSQSAGSPVGSQDLGAALSGAEGTQAVSGTEAAATAPPPVGGTPKP